MRELCANLLPHLRFSGVESKNRDQIRCLWNVHGAKDGVDIDELSSGEKSIIQMFFPLVERGIRQLLSEVSGEESEATRPEQCVLIDEPELHLHPNLQVKVLDYLRVLTTGTHTQVILATHSPTIVESAGFEELYLLRPVELVSADENQLIQIASDDDRLDLLRLLFGTTSNLTSMQPLIVVEGTHEDAARKVVADRKLYRALHPAFDHVTLVAGGGKSECMALVRALEEPLRMLSSKLSAVALVDKDYQCADTEPANIFLLPVSMIENFLLDPDALWQAMQSVVEKTGISSTSQVAALLAELLDALERDEIERRASVKLGPAIFRASRPLNEVVMKADAFSRNVLQRYSQAAIDAAIAIATAETARLTAVSRRREEFHGKTVLQEFYARHLHQTPLSKVVFTFEAARHARNRKSVKRFFDEFFAKVNPDWKLGLEVTDKSDKPKPQ